MNKNLSEIIETQNYYYKNEELIRYIYGKQFNLLNYFLKEKRTDSISSFLKYLTNDIDRRSNLEFHYDNNLGKGNKLICSLENINNYLKNLLKINNISLKAIYEQNIIKKEFSDLKGVYTYLLQDNEREQSRKGVEEYILNCYSDFTSNLPMAQTLLLCNEETTSEEITAFMHRAFLCQYNVVFMIGKIELLIPDKREILIGLINELYIGHEKQIKSCVIITYSDIRISLSLLFMSFRQG